MRKFTTCLSLAAALLLVGVPAAVEVQPCPIDKTTMTPTGNSRQEEGKTLAEYKCEKGHVYWIAVD